MANQFSLENRTKEKHLFRRRTLVIIGIIALLTFLLIGRLVYLQIFQYQYYTTLSINNDIDLHPLPPRRGLIYDRNGLLLAKNDPSFDLVITPNKVNDIDKTIAQLSTIIPITQTDIELFKKQLSQHRRFDQIPIKLKLTPEEVATFSVNQFQFPEVSVKAELIRQYPLGAAFAHVLGYVGRINEEDLAELNPTNYAGTNFIGKVGIEKYYEQQLHGAVGYEKVENNADGETIRTISTTPSTKGEDLYLTLDTSLQIATEEALGKDRGAVIAIDPNNGEILALVSQPAYDPNLFVQGINDQDFQKLQNDPDFPLYNRALRGLFAPGSVVKPFIAVLGLDANVITPTFQIFDPGWYRVPGTTHTFHDWKLTGHGWVNVSKAIIESCDTYFFDLAHKLGIARINNIFQAFGFGQATAIDMGEELPGNLPTPEWKMQNRGIPWYSGDTVQEGIGQGSLQITPLQLAVATAIIATHGKHFEPHLLYETKMADGDLLKQEPIEKDPVILKNPQNWQTVINAMSKVIYGDTGYRFGKPSYTVAAKTGTAQLYSKKQDDQDPNKIIPIKLRNNSTFIAFAPIDHPQIAIAVVDQNSTSAPIIARKVLDQYLLKESHLNGNTNDH